jgi:hypothetical protein
MPKINYGYQLHNFDRFKVLYPNEIKVNIFLLTCRKGGWKDTFLIDDFPIIVAVGAIP